MFKKLTRILLVLAVLGPLAGLAPQQTARADQPSVMQNDNGSISILDTLKTLPLKEGMTYDVKNNRFLNTLGYGIVEYKNVGLDVSYIGVDGIGATLEYNLSNLPVQSVPIIKYLSYLNVGYSVGWRTLALGDTSGNPKSDNQFIHGPTVFLKINF